MAVYIEQLGTVMAKPSVNSIWPLLGNFSLTWLPVASCRPNPAGAVRGPKYVGKAWQDSDSLGRPSPTMAREDVLAMMKRRAKAAALPYSTCCHTFRATGITTYMQNGGTLEHAQQNAAHESPRTTKLCDRTQDEISLDEVERIRI